MSYYTSKEKRLKDAAQAVLDDPNATFDQLDKAKRRIDQLAAKAAKRTNTSKPEAKPEALPDADGWQPTTAQQYVIDRLEEDGKPEEAEVWGLVYKMEAEDLKRRQAAAKPGYPDALCPFCQRMGQLAGTRDGRPICTVCAKPFILAAQKPNSLRLQPDTAPPAESKASDGGHTNPRRCPMKRPTSFCTCDSPTRGEWHGLTVCTHCECFFAYPKPSPAGITDTDTGFIVGGAPAPTNLLSQQIVPRANDVEYWTAEAEKDRRRRILAGATPDGEGTEEERLQAQAIIELARRELRGEA